MQGFIASSIAGTLLGLAFYVCVRARMYVAPRLRARYGNWARQIYWLLTILLMILLANLTLIELRDYLEDQSLTSNQLMLEIWFVIVAVALSFGLIYRRMTRSQ